MPDAQVSFETAEETISPGNDIFHLTKSIDWKPSVPKERI